MHSLEGRQKDIIDKELNEGHLKVNKMMKIFLKKDILEQLPPKCNLLISYIIEKLSEFGIKSVTYKQETNHH